jgi:hypothetical protein
MIRAASRARQLLKVPELLSVRRRKPARIAVPGETSMHISAKQPEMLPNVQHPFSKLTAGRLLLLDVDYSAKRSETDIGADCGRESDRQRGPGLGAGGDCG